MIFLFKKFSIKFYINAEYPLFRNAISATGKKTNNNTVARVTLLKYCIAYILSCNLTNLLTMYLPTKRFECCSFAYNKKVFP